MDFEGHRNYSLYSNDNTKQEHKQDIDDPEFDLEILKIKKQMKLIQN